MANIFIEGLFSTTNLQISKPLSPPRLMSNKITSMDILFKKSLTCSAF